MRALIAIDGPDWEAVVRAAARDLPLAEALLLHVIDERAAREYGLAARGLLGRHAEAQVGRLRDVAEAATRDLLAEAARLLRGLRPDLSVAAVSREGRPAEAILAAAREEGIDLVVVGRGAAAPGAVTVSGVVQGWRRNRHGDVDGLVLEGGAEVTVPPHRAGAVMAVARPGEAVVVEGERRAHHVHAYRVTNAATGVTAEAHPPRPAGHLPLGATARAIVDHAPCHVLLVVGGS